MKKNNTKKILLPIWTHRFKIGLNEQYLPFSYNNMDHTYGYGIDPSSVIFSQMKFIEVWNVMPKQCHNKLTNTRSGFVKSFTLKFEFEILSSTM